MKDTRIGIAMSGGVDSTACALLLRDHYQVEGFFMHLAQPNLAAQEERVRSIATRLGISLRVIDLSRPFTEKVLDYFSASYFRGLTPNPCVICNREIKFGLFMDAMLSFGMTGMATGHYAQILKTDNIHRLYKGSDPKKDQSYFLSRLSQAQLAKIIFPLGDRTKESTYRFVEEHGFDDFHGLESQDVCFLGNNELGNFLESQAKGEDTIGPIISTSGKRLGSHRGLFHYTIGQRRGLGIPFETPLYVVGLDVEKNAVIVGSNSDLLKGRILAEKFHWLSGSPPDTKKMYTVRIRYSHPGSIAKLALQDDGSGEFVFDEPQRAITPGQFAVVYDDAELLGSGIIVGEKSPQ
ncbi:MAG: tRNA 2-thiouridine(34) synthase MnmA [Proteobacteria bacterium]|nr:tRNA 2-thiouridine(34) synthase MnmA [Pseudomonadota bacterium]